VMTGAAAGFYALYRQLTGRSRSGGASNDAGDPS
jgi:hypothetical protein